MNYEKLNHIFEDKTFEYNGPIFILDSKYKINFKFKIVGTKEMISIGELVEFYLVDVDIIKIPKSLLIYLYIFGPESVENLNVSKITSGDVEPSDLNFDTVSKKLSNSNLLLWGFGAEIESLLKFANIENVKINKVNLNLPKKDYLNEHSMSRNTKPTRDVIRDIVNILKTKEEGEFNLPIDEDYYSFKKYPLEFSVELEIRHDENLTGFKMNGNYVPEEEVIELLIICNPNTLTRDYYNIIGELNEIITHELEHGKQEYRGELEDIDLDVSNNLEYYLQPHEIQAQVKGFKRLSKLKRVPFINVVKHWFNTHRDIHGLTKDEENIVIDTLMDYNSKN